MAFFHGTFNEYIYITVPVISSGFPYNSFPIRLNIGSSSMDADSESLHSPGQRDYDREETELNRLSDQICKTLLPFAIFFAKLALEQQNDENGRQGANQRAVDSLLEEAWVQGKNKMKRRLKHRENQISSVRRQSQIQQLTEVKRSNLPHSPMKGPLEHALGNRKARSPKRNRSTSDENLGTSCSKRSRNDTGSDVNDESERVAQCECPFRKHTSLLAKHKCPKPFFAGDTAVRDCR